MSDPVVSGRRRYDTRAPLVAVRDAALAAFQAYPRARGVLPPGGYWEAHRKNPEFAVTLASFVGGTAYGITREQRWDLMAAADWCCPICKRSLLPHHGLRTATDHNHETGEVRGILCVSCNLGLGVLRDNPDVLRAAAAYLEANGYYG